MRSFARLQIVALSVAFGYTLWPVGAHAVPTETEFNYQGQLKQNGAPLIREVHLFLRELRAGCCKIIT